MTAEREAPAAPPPGLRRSLGLVQLTASGVGLIIGAGIYVLLAPATEEAGAGVWAGFAVAGVLSAFTGLSYAELASMYPKAGAEYDYVRRIAPPWTAFVVGWMMVAGLVIAAAAVALGFAAYLQRFVEVPVRLGAWGLLVLVTLIALAGIERSAAVSVALAVVQVGGLVAVIVVGIPYVGDHSLVDGISFGGTIGAAALVFFAFIGFDEVITLAEETRDPTRSVPRALLLGLGISTALYVLVAIVAVSVLGPGLLAASEQPLADVLQVAVGGVGDEIVAVVALLATTNTTLLVVTAASRVLYGMATVGAVPPGLAGLSGRQVPWRAVSAVVIGAAAFVTLGDIGLVASVTDVAVYLVFVAVNGTVIALRYWQPKRRRPFRSPVAIGRLPVLPVAGLVTTFLLIPALDPAALGLGALVATLGLGLHLVWQRRSGVAAPARIGQDDDVFPRTRVSQEEAEHVARVMGVDLATVPWSLDQLRAGMQVELEHGRGDPDTNVTDDDLVQTGKIALAHLNEIADYYTRLAAMEAEALAESDGRPEA